MEIKIRRSRRNHHGIKCLFEDNYKKNVWFYLLKISTNMFMLKMEFSIFTLDFCMWYIETCLNGTPLGLKNLFSTDRCLVYTGSNYIDILYIGL